MRLGWATIGALLVVVPGARGQAGQAQCDTGSKCTFSTTHKGKPVSFDFRGLCNGGNDYVLTDAVGHTYYAQVCGTAAKSCLPDTWENDYEYGRVIQTWGSPPPCDNSCVEERTGAPTCCTEPCQVIAVLDPLFSTIVPDDPTKGVRLTYFGETPTAGDPYPCEFDPTTGLPFPRVTHMQFFCDPTVTGFANLYEVDQNATDNCDYTLSFKTNLVCLPGLSGGWIFVIIISSVFAAYAIFGTLYNVWRHKTWSFPNRAFWVEAESLIWDGVRFVAAGFRKPAPRSGAAKPFASSSEGSEGNPFGGSSAVITGSSYSSSSATSAYQTIGTASDAPKGSAYTDL